MSAKSLVLGVLVGLLAGYLLFHSSGSGPSEGRAPAATPRGASIAPVAEQHGPQPAPGDSREERFRAGTAEDIYRCLENGMGNPSPPISAAEVRTLLARLDAARATGDRPLFFAVVRALAASGLEPAQQRLLELMADESLPDLMGRDFLRGLEKCELPGIADAAKRRFELNIAAGDTSWVAGDGWFDLVALRGDEAQIDWMLSQRQSAQLRSQSLEALVSSSAASAIRRVEAMIREGSLDARLLGAFARQHPAIAIDLLQERVSRNGWGATGDGAGAIAGAYGRHLPEERLPEAQSLLRSLAEPGDRLGSVYAVQALASRGLDTAGFEDLLLVPVEILEGRYGDENDLKSSARYAIEYNPLTWSERAANALERAGFKGEASKVRAGLKSPWRKR